MNKDKVTRKEVKKMIKSSEKEIKRWDVKQDKTLLKKKKKK